MYFRKCLVTLKNLFGRYAMPGHVTSITSITSRIQTQMQVQVQEQMRQDLVEVDCQIE